MACKVLAYTKDALFVDLRYMGRAFQIMTPQADRQITTLAADGEVLHYSSEQLIRVFQKNDKYLNRLYLHSVLHCLFQHLWIGGQRERLLWHVACDIAVESGQWNFCSSGIPLSSGKRSGDGPEAGTGVFCG